jgi:hypothetical protein
MKVLARLKGRSLAELQGRASQRIHALVERLPGTRPDVGALEPLRRQLQESQRGRFATADDWSTGLLGGRFFPGTDDLAATTAAAREVDPAFEAWCLDRARRALEGRFDLLGHRDIAWGTPIDWHREPISGVRAPRLHWSRIRYLDPAVVGDHKLLWELNRHQVLVSFAQAACLTGDDRWADACFSWLDEWMTQNPPSIGANWASSLEVAFRAISWIWSLRLLDRPLPPALALRVASHLQLAGRHLETYLSTWFSPNTHLTGEALGLLYLGTQLPQFRAAARWRDTAWDILLEQLPRHVRPDGVYFEQATWYHRYTVDFYLHAMLLAERNGVAVPAEVRQRVVLALDHLAAITRGDGTMPLIGDDDGGKLVVLDARSAQDTRAALAQGAVLFDRPDLAAIAAGASSELAWMLGAEGVSRFGRLAPALPSWTSRDFSAGGYYVLRDGWTPTSSVLVLDCGPHGVLNCGHAHADALAFDLSVGGTPVFVDPGTATYTGSARQRDHFRSSAAHNTVTIDGRSSSVMAGPFQWARIARARVEAWVSQPAFDYFQGSHDGYTDLPEPATHRRSVLFVRGAGIWVVRDDILSEGTHDIMVTFQGAPGITMEPAGPGRLRCRAGSRAVAVLSAAALPEGAGLAVEVMAVSPCYGVTTEAPAARIRARTSGQATFTTVIEAVGPGAAPDGAGGAPWHERVARLRGTEDGTVPRAVVALIAAAEGLS